MTKFHINPNTGVINRCHAVSLSACPYGGDSGDSNHFDSINNARSYYEKVMKERALKTLKKNNDKKPIPSIPNNDRSANPYGEKNSIKSPIAIIPARILREAERTRDSNRINELSRMNDENVFTSILRNANATPESLTYIKSHSIKNSIRRQALHHPNYPIKELTIDEFYRTLDTDNKIKRFNDNDITDEHVLRVLDQNLDLNVPVTSPYYNASLKMVRNSNNKVTPGVVARVAKERARTQYQKEHYIQASNKL